MKCPTQSLISCSVVYILCVTQNRTENPFFLSQKYVFLGYDYDIACFALNNVKNTLA